MSQFGKQPTTPLTELAWTAIGDALVDAADPPASPSPEDVDAVFVGNVFGEPGIATRTLKGFGITGRPVVTIENACASGTSALHEAVAAIESGRYERVLVLGLENMSTLFKGPILPQQTDA